MLEIGVKPSVENGVGDGVEHREGVDDEEEGQLHLGVDSALLDDLKTWNEFRWTILKYNPCFN